MFDNDGPSYWSKITLEICRHEEDFTKFFGTVCIRSVPLIFELKFLMPIETMNLKEGQKEIEIRKILFSIKISDLSHVEQTINTDKEYDFFYNILVSYAVKLHTIVESRRLLDRRPEVDMTTPNWPGIQIPTRSDIFVYMVKTSEVPESLKQKFIRTSAP